MSPEKNLTFYIRREKAAGGSDCLDILELFMSVVPIVFPLLECDVHDHLYLHQFFP